MIPNAWTLADNCYLSDNHHPIQIKASHVQGVPKGFTIQASINGHTLTVAFSQNIGQVEVEITTVTGSTVDCLSILTPNGLQSYIPNTGDYIVTFTLCKWQIKNQQFFVINFHQFFVISFHQFWIVLRKSAVEAEAA